MRVLWRLFVLCVLAGAGSAPADPLPEVVRSARRGTFGRMRNLRRVKI